MSEELIIKFRIVGYHQCLNPPPLFEFQSYLHRHNFEIECRKLHDDTEAIAFKEIVMNFLYDSFGTHLDGINFQKGSCATIARLLTQEFDLTYCAVRDEWAGGILVRNDKVGKTHED